MTRALVPLANGVEEIEAVIIIDALRRAKWEVVSAGIGGTMITASRRVRLLADADWLNITPDSFDLMVIPGGSEGTKNLSADPTVLAAIRDFVQAGRIVAAVCAGPLVLQAAGVLDGRKATCHPSVRSKLTTAIAQDHCVVRDENIVTSQGPGTTFEFVLAVIEMVEGIDAARTVAKGLVLGAHRRKQSNV